MTFPEFHVSYRGASQGLNVSLIHEWKRGDIAAPVYSASSGPKDYIKNVIWAVFDGDPSIDLVRMVRANGPLFLLMHRPSGWADVTKEAVRIVELGPS